jgi:hypothetical protein
MKTQRQAEADARGRTCDENGIASGLHGFLLVDKKGKIKNGQLSVSMKRNGQLSVCQIDSTKRRACG